MSYPIWARHGSGAGPVTTKPVHAGHPGANPPPASVSSRGSSTTYTRSPSTDGSSSDYSTDSSDSDATTSTRSSALSTTVPPSTRPPSNFSPGFGSPGGYGYGGGGGGGEMMPYPNHPDHHEEYQPQEQPGEGLTTEMEVQLQKLLWVQQMLMTGRVFVKHSINNKGKKFVSHAQNRFIFLSRDRRYLMWTPPNKPNYANYATRHPLDFSQPTYKGSKEHKSFIALADVRKVIIGVTEEVEVRKGEAPLDVWKNKPDDRNLFSFISNKRSLTLEANTAEECEFFASAWNFYIFSELRAHL